MNRTQAPITVAVVDDNPLVRQSVERWLTPQHGLVCTGAYSDPETALAALSACQPQVLLLDIDLPGSDAWDMLSTMVERYPQTRVLMFSGNAEPDAVLRAVDARAAGYIVKDEGMPVILDMIRKAVGGEIVISPTASAAMMSAGPEEAPAPPTSRSKRGR